MVTIAVTAEREGEPRVAVSPETVKKLSALGCQVKVEAGAGAHSRFADDALKAAGATVAPNAAEALSGADILLKVRRPLPDEVKALKPGAIVAAILAPFDDRPGLEALAGTGVSLMAMEFMPRITRAQSMDVLSSQANLAGYKAVIDAAAMFGQAMPMMMTAAGTVPAARVFIMGVGVAGLQAIATARRLGAIVSATDVRPATKEQVASLGAKFIAVEDEEFKQAQTAAGYAKPMSAEYQKKQAELVASHIKGQDIVITTALIPGRPAPRLISAAMVESMKPGSVIFDLAAERGGNCELTKPGEVVEHKGVRIAGPLNLAGEVPVNASSLYAKNLLAFLETMIDKKEKALKVNWDDEIVKGTLVAKDGKIVHPSLAPAAASAVAGQSVKGTALGIRFDIAKVEQVVPGLGYGAACWKVFWTAVRPEQIAFSSLHEGDTQATLDRKENAYLLVLENDDGATLARARGMLESNEQFKRVAASPMFTEGPRVMAEPVILSGRVDRQGSLVQVTGHCGDGLKASRG